ncbi:MAG TPA: class D sortase [Anaerolineaceae bacterium]|nr:class D sortase [Anaerolineaceae bacterium]HPN49948.1 class D sortase [Anaerolineaceae bacterium]
MVAKQRSIDDLTVDELRQLLIEKRRSTRRDRLEFFRRTGRVIVVAPDPQPGISNARTEVVPGETAAEPAVVVRKPRQRMKLWDGLLLLVEVAAVIGIVLVLLSGVSMLGEINQEAISAWQMPTLTPTPIISAVVLPSGHSISAVDGKATFNNDEIPEHLRPLVQAQAEIPIPTPGVEQATRIQIPAISVYAPVVQGDGWEQLRRGVGQHIGSANPGQKGNLVLSAHNDIYGEIFRDLDQLKVGDQVIIYTQQKQYTYIVSNSQVVMPTQVDVMAPSSNATLTLISCYPRLVDNRRIVISAELQSSQ